MLYLRNNLAKHEVNVARYYVKRGAYLAAIERCNYVIEHFQRTSAVESALEVMIDAYKRLGEDELAADAQRVLKLNREAGRFLPDDVPPSEVSLSRKIWDYLELDKN
jgi:outer membrane protein assembly factor BamD